ncbi:MAG: HD domain-containing protein [Proteobacteria bacterium]|nr:HD domain-containing protein [Pseudomonadota bacterium]
MNTQDVQTFKNWFYFYVKSFASDDPEFQRNMDLKEQHTKRVCQEATDIGKDLGLNEADLCLAEVSALFHDVGRFEQYRQFKTFSDRHSVNHAEFGVAILEKEGVLNRLESPVKDLIKTIISYHNRPRLPEDEDEKCLLFSRLLRDADKLDIWRVVTDYYQQMENGNKNEAVELDLPDTPGISRPVFDRIIQGEPVLFENMKNLNDFKLLQAGWVYDVNFAPSLRRLRDRGYLKKLQKALPDSEEIQRIFKTIESHVEGQLNP